MSKLDKFNQIMRYVLAVFFSWQAIGRLISVINYFNRTHIIAWWSLLMVALTTCTVVFFVRSKIRPSRPNNS